MLRIQDKIKVNQFHPGNYRDGKNMRVGQGIKRSSLWKILTLGQHAGRVNFTQNPIELQRCLEDTTPRGVQPLQGCQNQKTMFFFS
ncbi:hypothetical protein DDT91_00390 [Algoriphagus sp. AK58]|nr:hypothetical protein [Algoriphagus sp. AK58]